MSFDREAIRISIVRALEVKGEGDAYTRNDIAFHLTDWIDDLEAWVRFCEKPHETPPTEVAEMLMHFLIHVPNHVAAAMKLHLGWGVSDVFGVGSVDQIDGETRT